MSLDPAIYKNFVEESKKLCIEMEEILVKVEKQGVFEQQKLEQYSNLVDRIMGGARTLATEAGPGHALNLIGDYCSFGKKISKKTAEIDITDQFFSVCLAILHETTTTLKVILANIDQPSDKIKDKIPEGMVDRLRFVYQQFSDSEASGNIEMNQSEIDDLMKKLGM
jgi:hypothetical protein